MVHPRLVEARDRDVRAELPALAARDLGVTKGREKKRLAEGVSNLLEVPKSALSLL